MSLPSLPRIAWNFHSTRPLTGEPALSLRHQYQPHRARLRVLILDSSRLTPPALYVWTKKVDTTYGYDSCPASPPQLRKLDQPSSKLEATERENSTFHNPYAIFIRLHK